MNEESHWQEIRAAVWSNPASALCIPLSFAFTIYDIVAGHPLIAIIPGVAMFVCIVMLATTAYMKGQTTEIRRQTEEIEHRIRQMRGLVPPV